MQTMSIDDRATNVAHPIPAEYTSGLNGLWQQDVSTASDSIPPTYSDDPGISDDLVHQIEMASRAGQEQQHADLQSSAEVINFPGGQLAADQLAGDQSESHHTKVSDLTLDYDEEAMGEVDTHLSENQPEKSMGRPFEVSKTHQQLVETVERAKQLNASPEAEQSEQAAESAQESTEGINSESPDAEQEAKREAEERYAKELEERAGENKDRENNQNHSQESSALAEILRVGGKGLMMMGKGAGKLGIGAKNVGVNIAAAPLKTLKRTGEELNDLAGKAVIDAVAGIHSFKHKRSKAETSRLLSQQNENTDIMVKKARELYKSEASLVETGFYNYKDSARSQALFHDPKALDVDNRYDMPNPSGVQQALQDRAVAFEQLQPHLKSFAGSSQALLAGMSGGRFWDKGFLESEQLDQMLKGFESLECLSSNNPKMKKHLSEAMGLDFEELQKQFMEQIDKMTESMGESMSAIAEGLTQKKKPGMGM